VDDDAFGGGVLLDYEPGVVVAVSAGVDLDVLVGDVKGGIRTVAVFVMNVWIVTSNSAPVALFQLRPA
jgi:hypothetical protein